MRIVYIFFSLMITKYCLAADHNLDNNNEYINEEAKLTPNFDNTTLSSNNENKDGLKRRYEGADNYNSHSDIIEKQDDFIKLPFDDIIAILKNPHFTTDSEESVFTLMMMWLKAKQKELWGDNFSSVDKQEKLYFIENYLRPILDLIDFNRMSRFYLAYQVKSYLEEYDNDIYIAVIANNKEKSSFNRKYDTYPRFGIRTFFSEINNFQKRE